MTEKPICLLETPAYSHSSRNGWTRSPTFYARKALGRGAVRGGVFDTMVGVGSGFPAVCLDADPRREAACLVSPDCRRHMLGRVGERVSLQARSRRFDRAASR